jgi:hypothetical protein
METNKNQIKSAIGYSLFWKIVGLINWVLVFLGLRKHREFWGVIYDSVTKQPLDPVIVKMAYVQTGHVIETCVTDLEGRYGFLARPGKFKIFAQKTNYHFPSSVVAGAADGMFDDVYHGEFFELAEDAEVVAPNIPMDPTATDWNQSAKQEVLPSHYLFRYFLQRLVGLFFWFGAVLMVIYLFYKPSIPVFGVLVIYTLLFLCTVIIPDVRLWGLIVSASDGRPLTDIMLELQLPMLNDVVMGKARSQEGGKYFLRANPGKYILVAKRLDENNKPEVIGKFPVVIGHERILNKKIIVVD